MAGSMKRFGKAAAAAGLLAAAAVAVAANPYTNPGFESGDFSGWNKSIVENFGFPIGDAFTTTGLGYGSGSMSPQEGSYYGAVSSGWNGQYNRFWQTASLGKKDKISGYGFFATYDYWPFNDDGQVHILSGDENGSVVATGVNASVGSIGSFNSTGWQAWEYEVATPGDFTVLGQVRNNGDSGVDSYIGIDGLEFEKGIIEVTLDVKPGSSTNPINTKSTGVVPVAILGSSDFDVNDVVVGSLRFGPGGATEAHDKGHYEDVNEDGITDLVLHFDTQACGFTAGDTSAEITGEVSDGTPLVGSDVVTVK